MDIRMQSRPPWPRAPRTWPRAARYAVRLLAADICIFECRYSTPLPELGEGDTEGSPDVDSGVVDALSGAVVAFEAAVGACARAVDDAVGREARRRRMERARGARGAMAAAVDALEAVRSCDVRGLAALREALGAASGGGGDAEEDVLAGVLADDGPGAAAAAAPGGPQKLVPSRERLLRVADELAVEHKALLRAAEDSTVTAASAAAFDSSLSLAGPHARAATELAVIEASLGQLVGALLVAHGEIHIPLGAASLETSEARAAALALCSAMAAPAPALAVCSPMRLSIF